MQQLLGEWKGKRIRVNPSDSDFINATDMCKATGKQWNDYWRLQDTTDFIDQLSLQTGIPVCDIVMPVKGYGTWVHMDVALDLARWADKRFHVWMIQQTRKLMTTGHVAIHPEHQEAQIGPVLYEILSEVKTSNHLTSTIVGSFDRSLKMYEATLAALNRKTGKQLEPVIQRQLIKDEGGLGPDVSIGPGFFIDVLQPGKYAIEVKHWKNYRHAGGQLDDYGIFLDAEVEKRMHLFTKQNESMPSNKKLEHIKRYCRLKGVTLTWHSWDYLKRPEFQQAHLPLAYE